MKPVLVFRHVACEGPAYVSRFLERHGMECRIIRVDAGEPVPDDTGNASALVFMGGPMSVNDDLPWIARELELIRKAHGQGIPVLGHCLGGQLVSKALGGEISAGQEEFGWFPLEPHDSGEGPGWLEELDFSTEIFHWHGEQFSLPGGATPLFSTAACRNQGFILDGSMALQCHVEVEQDDIAAWLEFYKDEIPQPSMTVQTGAEMQRDTENRIARLQVFADSLYNHWLKFFQGS